MGKREDELLAQFQKEFNMDVYDAARDEFAIKVWVTTTSLVLASMAKKFGWEAVNEQLREYWKERAKQRMKFNVARVTSHGEPRDCVTLGRMIVTNKAACGEYKFVEITPKRLHLIEKGCDEAAVLKEQGLMGKLFWPCTTIWRAAYGTELNPKMKFTSVKAECEGDDCCEHIWEIKD